MSGFFRTNLEILILAQAFQSHWSEVLVKKVPQQDFPTSPSEAIRASSNAEAHALKCNTVISDTASVRVANSSSSPASPLSVLCLKNWSLSTKRLTNPRQASKIRAAQHESARDLSAPRLKPLISQAAWNEHALRVAIAALWQVWCIYCPIHALKLKGRSRALRQSLQLRELCRTAS